jgi:hypothetical protein
VIFTKFLRRNSPRIPPGVAEFQIPVEMYHGDVKFCRNDRMLKVLGYTNRKLVKRWICNILRKSRCEDCGKSYTFLQKMTIIDFFCYKRGFVSTTVNLVLDVHNSLNVFSEDIPGPCRSLLDMLNVNSKKHTRATGILHMLLFHSRQACIIFNSILSSLK